MSPVTVGSTSAAGRFGRRRSRCLSAWHWSGSLAQSDAGAAGGRPAVLQELLHHRRLRRRRRESVAERCGGRQGDGADFGARRSRRRRHPGRIPVRADGRNRSVVGHRPREVQRFRPRSGLQFAGESAQLGSRHDAVLERRAGLEAAGWSRTAPTSCGSCRSVRTENRSSSGPHDARGAGFRARRSATLMKAAPRAGAGRGRARSARAWSWSTGIRRSLSRRSSSTTAASRRPPSRR